MASREEFLTTVREALAHAGGREADDAPLAPLSPEEVRERARLVRATAESRRGELLETLATEAERQEWKLVRVSSLAEAGQAVAQIAAKLGVTRAVRSEHRALEEAGIDEALASVGVEVTLMMHDEADIEGSRARLREVAAEAGMGITGVDYMLAETATAALVSRRGVSRQVGLLPPVHVAVVEASQVVQGMADLLALRQADQMETGDGRWYMNLISGPSRTADIEQTIVVGVHGPGEVHLVLVAPGPPPAR
jgi:L-lactate dehydrogenase complex protein LldG